jgi:hypothetical protein
MNWAANRQVVDPLQTTLDPLGSAMFCQQADGGVFGSVTAFEHVVVSAGLWQTTILITLDSKIFCCI